MSDAAAALPLPEHTCEVDGEGMLLKVRLPLVAGSGQVELSVNEAAIEVDATGLYRPLRVPLPKAPKLNTDKASARFDKASKTLKIRLPPIAA